MGSQPLDSIWVMPPVSFSDTTCSRADGTMIVTTVMDIVSDRFNPVTHQTFSWVTIFFQLFTSASTLSLSASSFPPRAGLLAGPLLEPNHYRFLQRNRRTLGRRRHNFLQASILMPFCRVGPRHHIAGQSWRRNGISALTPAANEDAARARRNSGGSTWRAGRSWFHSATTPAPWRNATSAWTMSARRAKSRSSAADCFLLARSSGLFRPWR